MWTSFKLEILWMLRNNEKTSLFHFYYPLIHYSIEFTSGQQFGGSVWPFTWSLWWSCLLSLTFQCSLTFRYGLPILVVENYTAKGDWLPLGCVFVFYNNVICKQKIFITLNFLEFSSFEIFVDLRGKIGNCSWFPNSTE